MYWGNRGFNQRQDRAQDKTGRVRSGQFPLGNEMLEMIGMSRQFFSIESLERERK